MLWQHDARKLACLNHCVICQLQSVVHCFSVSFLILLLGQKTCYGGLLRETLSLVYSYDFRFLCLCCPSIFLVRGNVIWTLYLCLSVGCLKMFQLDFYETWFLVDIVQEGHIFDRKLHPDNIAN